jgi:hypothetical protein
MPPCDVEAGVATPPLGSQRSGFRPWEQDVQSGRRVVRRLGTSHGLAADGGGHNFLAAYAVPILFRTRGLACSGCVDQQHTVETRAYPSLCAPPAVTGLPTSRLAAARV